jgi:hypothetical protein
MALKITLVLVSVRRRIQARCKELVKVRVKFIRKGYTFDRLKVGCLYSENNWGRGEKKDSKLWSPCLSLIVESWGIHVVKDNGSGWMRWLLTQGGVISWIWVIVFSRETLSNLLVPALIDREFLFEIPSLYFIKLLGLDI